MIVGIVQARTSDPADEARGEVAIKRLPQR